MQNKEKIRIMEKLERTFAVEKLCDLLLRGCPPSVGV